MEQGLVEMEEQFQRVPLAIAVMLLGELVGVQTPLSGGVGGTGGGSAGAGGYGGGGGSFNAGTDQVNTVDVGTGNGQIIITELCAAITITASATEICVGEELTLEEEAMSGEIVSWDMGVIDGDAFTPDAGMLTFTVTTIDASDCETTIDIEVYELPEVIGVSTEDEVCEGVEITLTGSGGTTYDWGTDVTDGVAFIPELIGENSYTVTGTDDNGCINVSSVEITVYDSITTIFTSTEELFGDDGSIDLTVSGGNPAYSFDWDNDGTGDFDDPEDLTGLAGGTYTVVIEDAAGCMRTEVITLDSQLGIENNLLDGVSLFPNPTTDIVTLTYNGTFGYVVYGFDGKRLMTKYGYKHSYNFIRWFC